MRISQAKKIAKKIIDLSQNNKVDKELLEKELFNLALDVPEKFSNEIITDFDKLDS